jgi:hypothetical protein
MNDTPERRREQRLRYHWPVWFAENFNEILSQGQMVDICSGGVAFTCYADRGCPWPGQHITTRFSVPRYQPDESFNVNDFIRAGLVRRVDHLHNGLRRVAIRFFDPLPFKPGEQENTQAIPEPAIV